MTKLKITTRWYDQWKDGQPQQPSTPDRPRRIAVTLAIWHNAQPSIASAHPINPDLTIQFSRN